MESCRPALWVLLLLIIPAGSESYGFPLQLHESAALPCNMRCSGLVTWHYFNFYILALCNQTSCWSRNGYQMSHDQYLRGKLTLTISTADYSQTGLYSCLCDGEVLCNLMAVILPLTIPFEMKAGDSLVMKLGTSDPVEVIYNSSGAAGPSSGQICRVDGGSLQCRPEYTQRTSLSSSLELRGMKESDSGVYTIRDPRSREIIHVYAVSVQVPKTLVQIKPGDSLLLELDRSDPVEVIYNSSGAAGPSSVHICTVDGESLQCDPEYTERVYLSPALKLAHMRESDSGDYIIRDKEDKEIIQIYRVSVRALKSSIEMKASESLVLKLGTSGPVEVIYDGTGAAGPSSLPICTVDGGSLNCTEEYTQRASVTSSTLELRGAKVSDSGVYTIRDKEIQEDLLIYTVSIEGSKAEGAGVPGWVWCVVLVVLAVIGLYSLGYCCFTHQRRREQWDSLEQDISSL